jgi:hypothetical protein
MTKFYVPDLTVNIDNPFVRDGNDKLRRALSSRHRQPQLLGRRTRERDGAPAQSERSWTKRGLLSMRRYPSWGGTEGGVLLLLAARVEDKRAKSRIVRRVLLRPVLARGDHRGPRFHPTEPYGTRRATRPVIAQKEENLAKVAPTRAPDQPPYAFEVCGGSLTRYNASVPPSLRQFVIWLAGLHLHLETRFHATLPRRMADRRCARPVQACWPWTFMQLSTLFRCVSGVNSK